MAYYRILLADDEEQFRSTIVNCFPWNQYGFEISTQVSNGEEALKYLKRFQYDMVLSDIQMPIMSGIELAKYAMKMENVPYFIFLSGYQEFEYDVGICWRGEHLLNMGVLPYSTEQLQETLHNYELMQNDYIHVCIDYRMAGLGNGSLRAETLQQYRVYPEKIEEQVQIIPLLTETNEREDM